MTRPRHFLRLADRLRQAGEHRGEFTMPLPIRLPSGPIRRPADVWIPSMLAEFRRLARLPQDVVTFKLADSGDGFICRPTVASPFVDYCQAGQDFAGMLAQVQWLREGPKIVNVSEEQWQALSRVEVRLPVRDFSMPYPTLLVNMPAGKMHRYVLLHSRAAVQGREDDAGSQSIPLLIGASVSHDNTHDVVVVVRDKPDAEIEDSLGKFYGDVSSEEADCTHAAMRVACNMALAMTNFGCQASYLFPAEVVEQHGHVAKGNRVYKDGTRASDRLAEQPMVVVLDRDVKLYRREGLPTDVPGEPTGREMPFHWRRGHWHKVRCGKGKVNTRLAFYAPTMVRADLMTAPPEDTTTTYRG